MCGGQISGMRTRRACIPEWLPKTRSAKPVSIASFPEHALSLTLVHFIRAAGFLSDELSWPRGVPDGLPWILRRQVQPPPRASARELDRGSQ